ncbi:hypothetical protein ACR9GP_23465 [Enterobacter ludwigii]
MLTHYPVQPFTACPALLAQDTPDAPTAFAVYIGEVWQYLSVCCVRPVTAPGPRQTPQRFIRRERRT